jgi:large subunit ribosomal protein LP0
MSGAESAGRKQAYFAKLISYLDEYPKILIVGVDNVGSSQMQKIRKTLRGKAAVLMGKNTMIRKAIRGHIQNNPKLEALLPQVRGNVGFVFVKEDLSYVKKVIAENRVAAPARIGAIAPNNVIVPAGPTGLEPTQTAFLQALNIASRIAKGTIEIINDVPLIKAGDKVNNSQSTLLAKLSILPFSYGLEILQVYDDGALYDPKILDLSDDDILMKFHSGVRNLACVSLQVGLPTIASLPHSLARGYKNVLAVALATDVMFPAALKIRDYLKNPGAFAATTTSAPTKTPAVAPGKPAAPTPKAPEPEEEEDVGMGGLFD